jgi:branched-chain amino acid transport system ATP-binding protein
LATDDELIGGKQTVPGCLAEAENKATILQLIRLNKYFGGLKAVSDFSITLESGELKGLIGPNGAGKSTVFNLISGLYKPTDGRVLLDREDITGRRPDFVARKRVARTFQTVKLLANRSVLETMMTAFFPAYNYNMLSAILQTRRYRRQEQELEQQAIQYLAKLGVDHLKDEYSDELPYGLQRKVSIAAALCLNPRVLLLDEPMAGLTQPEKAELSNILLKLRQEYELSIILVEHDMKVIMNLCDSIAVMNNGCLIAEGSSEEIRHDPEVIRAYLGKGAA